MRSACVALLLVLSVLAGPVPAQMDVDDDAPASPPSRRGSSILPASIHVDDDAPGDPAPFDRQLGDPQEDGSVRHPYDSIQEAIDAAEDGATIIVAPGRYLARDSWSYDEINFRGKNISLISRARTDFSGIEQTILCGVVVFQGTEDPNCLLQGFKIQNHYYGGILGNKTQATISHCIISGNGPCGATVIEDVRGRIANCLIVDNTTFHNCGVLPVIWGCRELVNCTIANNLSGVEFTNDGLPPGGRVTIRNCIIYGNQGEQLIYRWNRSLPTTGLIEYCLMEKTSVPSSGGAINVRDSTLLYANPSFVRPGYWVDLPVREFAQRPSSTQTVQTVKKTLVEGDYHLQSEGWLWSPEPVHGSHWYFDLSTSPAIDAGDPIDSLGEELERVPDDPEGRWGVNHAIDLGAYGGTAQASLAPTRGEPPGIGTVDLRDYWPLAEGNAWLFHPPQGTARRLFVSGQTTGSRGTVYSLGTADAPDWLARISCYYLDRTLYLTQDAPLNPPAQHFQAQYPQFLSIGATIQAAYDPFVRGAVQFRSVLIVRGTLAAVLAGTSLDPAQFLAGSWLDVIALKERNAVGTAGDPIAIFARGLGPLLLAGRPVDGASIGDRTFGEGTRTTRTPARR